MIYRSVFFRLSSVLLLVLMGQSPYAYAKKQSSINLMLLDTVGREAAIYNPFIAQASEAGFNITYVPFDLFADTPHPESSWGNYHGYLFIFGLDFLIGLQEQSPFSKKIMHFFHTCVLKKNHLVGLVMPPLNIKPDGISIVNKLAPLFKPLINEPFPGATLLPPKHRSHRVDIEHFLQLSHEFLSKPLMSRPCLYHTTLQAPRPGIPFFTPQLQQLLNHQGNNLSTLPKMPTDVANKQAAAVNHMLPFGLYWFNPIHENHVFITSTNALSFTGIKEDFHLCPVNTAIREGMYQSIGMMMHELKSLCLEHKMDSLIISKQPVRRTKNLTKKNKHSKPNKSSKNTSHKKTAWMEIVIFQEPLEGQPTLTSEAKIEQTKQQDQLIDYIFQAGLKTLWISITPNILYSPIAREKHREKQILNAITLFTNKLSTYAQIHNKQVPDICVGFEITNNIYDPHLPATPAVDLYGSVYHDLPSPLSQQFWQNEIITSFKTFVHHWQNPEISHGIQLSGIVIDLEMYCRKKSGTFIETMGFDKPTFVRYMKKTNATYPTPSSPHEMISTLARHQECQKYFTFLEQEAETLGKKIYQEIATILPAGTISCYTPSILVDWFYKGFMKGISQAQQSLHLFTFNTLFEPHTSWFRENNIAADHSSVLLLSKLKEPKDFKWVNHIFKHHAGIWLNRFSRLVEKHDPKSWVGVEQTGMQDAQKTAFLNYLSNQ